jgi:hypothetical protein
MSIRELPETVRRAWGAEIAQEFTAWLAEQLSVAGMVPELQISAAVARRRVNALVLTRVSNLLLADEPRLEQNATGEWIWHVPVDLTFPSHGRVGRVGVVEVDAQYGEVRYTAALLAEMQKQAEKLANQVLAQPDA